MKGHQELNYEEKVYAFCIEVQGTDEQCEECSNKPWCDSDPERRKALEKALQ